MKRFLKVTLALTLLLYLFPAISTFAATGNEIVELAKKQEGTPYAFGGRTPSGFDCSGFTSYVFGQHDITLPRTSAEQYELGTKVAKEGLLPGDLVFFAGTYKAGISHVGIYIGDNKFISAKNQGVAIASMDNPYWGPKFAGGKRLDSVTQKVEFKDLANSHLAYNAIMELTGQKIINGFDDKTFKPENAVTRGQAAAIINRVLKLNASKKVTFKDLNANSSFYKDIAAMQEAGIITGFPDGTFRSNDYLTRLQMAVILQRAFGTDKLVKSASLEKVYKDVAPEHWAAEAIAAIYKTDKTKVFKTDSYRSSDNATRADFSAAIYNTYPTK